MAKTTSIQQVNSIKRLSQQAAAYMLGVNARSLRDCPDAPRHDDGTYDAAELLAWARTRSAPPEVDDVAYERLLQSLDVGEFEAWIGCGLLGVLKDLDQKYGDSGLAFFARMMIREAEEMRVKPYTEWRTKEEIRKIVEDEYKEALQEKAESELRRILQNSLEAEVVCDGCQRIRRGRKWVDQRPSCPERVLLGACPECIEKGLA